jgi:predicted metal-dependent HD superfamily phosphohydrolase
MFEELDAARAGGMAVEQLEVLELAIFGHNVEYVAGDAGHLYASARYMAQLLDRLGMSLQFCLLIVDLISATSDEYTLGRTPDQKLIYDLDHAVFKSDAREFDILCQQLEAEYTQFTTITEYAAARSAYLQALLDRPTVFRTQYFQQYESLAHENIQREIDRLSHAGGF